MENEQELMNAIAKMSRHNQIQDGLLTSMGETMALQQGLLHVPFYDGRSQSLKNFLQDVENGLTLIPPALIEAYFKGVTLRLRGTARDAVANQTINSLATLKEALKEFFAPKRTYSSYCAELQGCRMRKGETVLEYYVRLKRVTDGAEAALKESFNDNEVNVMKPMLNGIALESFKRGLSDELTYALSVQEPATLADAFRIAQRIERDMRTAVDKRASVSITDIKENESHSHEEREPQMKQVRFLQTSQLPSNDRDNEIQRDYWRGENNNRSREHWRARSPSPGRMPFPLERANSPVRQYDNQGYQNNFNNGYHHKYNGGYNGNSNNYPNHPNRGYSDRYTNGGNNNYNPQNRFGHFPTTASPPFLPAPYFMPYLYPMANGTNNAQGMCYPPMMMLAPSYGMPQVPQIPPIQQHDRQNTHAQPRIQNQLDHLNSHRALRMDATVSGASNLERPIPNSGPSSEEPQSGN